MINNNITCLQLTTYFKMCNCSMAGHLISMLRVLRLKQALQSTVTSPEFVQLNAFKDLAKVILDPDVWVWMFLQARAVYAMMRILRLADQKTAAMDKLYYYIKQADRVAPYYLAQAELYRNKLSADVVSVITSTDDLASQDVDAEDDDEVEVANDDGEESEDEEDDGLHEGEGKEDEVSTISIQVCIITYNLLKGSYFIISGGTPA